MGLQKVDVPLCIDTDSDGNPRVKNTAPSNDQAELYLFRLDDSITNRLTNVSVVEISNCDLSAIPNSIGDLNLKRLILNHNKLKEIPSCLYSGLESLELLDLSYNLLTEFEIMPACSKNIVILRLSHNEISNFPYWILNTCCPELREVYYSHNFLAKLDVNREFHIRRLEMCNSQLMDVDFTFLQKIKTLQYLDIGNDSFGMNENRFKDVNNLFKRHKWKNLSFLRLNNLLLSIIPQGVFFYTSVVELHLVNCALNWIPEDVQYLKNLQVLDISNNFICSLPHHLTSLTNLSVVKAPYNVIDSVGEFSKNLEILDLYSNKLDSFSFDLSRFAYIDLEKNILNALDLQDLKIYETKVDAFRVKFNLDRGYGPTPVQSPEASDSDCRSHSSLCDLTESSEEYLNVDGGEESLQKVGLDSTPYHDIECWDEVKPPKKFEEKNPQVTPSDEEWDGHEDINKRRGERTKLCSAWFDVDEDWVFADVEEE